MEKIRKYINNFKKRKEINPNYDIRVIELRSIAEEFKNDAWNALNTSFDFGS